MHRSSCKWNAIIVKSGQCARAPATAAGWAGATPENFPLSLSSSGQMVRLLPMRLVALSHHK